MTITDAAPIHTEAILSIYGPFITTQVTFENTIPPTAEFENRIRNYQQSFPWLVMVDAGQVAGYAYASKYRDREAYQWVVESSVYIHPDYKRKGVAQRLYKALFTILQSQGIYKVYAVITLPNAASVSLHEKMGFTWFATYKDVGYKLGSWKDVGWWELSLQQTESAPHPPILYKNMDRNMITKILDSH